MYKIPHTHILLSRPKKVLDLKKVWRLQNYEEQ